MTKPYNQLLIGTGATVAALTFVEKVVFVSFKNLSDITTMVRLQFFVLDKGQKMSIATITNDSVDES